MIFYCTKLWVTVCCFNVYKVRHDQIMENNGSTSWSAMVSVNCQLDMITWEMGPWTHELETVLIEREWVIYFGQHHSLFESINCLNRKLRMSISMHLSLPASWLWMQNKPFSPKLLFFFFLGILTYQQE